MTNKIGINGLGRIGRATLRIILDRSDIEVAAINDINPDINNIAYLIKYDSTYGKLTKSVEVEGDEIVIGNERRVKVYRHESIVDVPWSDSGVGIVVDSSGVKQNMFDARQLKDKGVSCCVVTNAPAKKDVDKAIVMGVNQDSFDPENDFLVSSSICDANAFAPVAKVLDERFGIEHGFLTTLHPWLNYQNLLCGPSISYATPGEIHDHYALGRSNIGSLIPKTTSAISATYKILKQLEGKFMSMSFRIPTGIVSTADATMKLKKKTSAKEIKAIFDEEEKKQKWKIFHNNKKALISADFTGSEYSAVVDHRWIMMNDQNFLKMVLWYDNEWGYSSRVADLAVYISNQKNA